MVALAEYEAKRNPGRRSRVKPACRRENSERQPRVTLKALRPEKAR